MINTLKTNKDLLRSRKMLFERDITFTKVRKRYAKASEGILKGPTATQADLRKIRERIIQDQKKKVVATFFLTSLIVLLIAIGGYFLVKNLVAQNHKEWQLQQVDFGKQQLTRYNHNIQEGFEKMESKNYFFAIGNFSEALNNLPNDSLAEYQLAYAYCLLCKTEQKDCSRASTIVERFSLKYPENQHYQLLKANYL